MIEAFYIIKPLTSPHLYEKKNEVPHQILRLVRRMTPEFKVMYNFTDIDLMHL